MAIDTIKLRRDTAANWTATNPTLANGEPGYETDTGKMKYGDGLVAWNLLPYFTASTVPAPVTSVNAKTGAVVIDKADIGLSSVPNTNFTADVAVNNAKVGITPAQASAIATNALKNTYPSGDATKVGNITVTQPVNLDTMESDVATNNAKTGITPTQTANIVTNNNKVGITPAQASDITTNNAKVGISIAQASNITANNAKTSNATHTGDATGSTALTLATVNANVGSFTNADVTVNAKGLVTAVANGAGGGGGGGAVSSVNTRTGAVTGLAENADLTAHTGNTANPHSVTKAQVGLSNVPNTDLTSAVTANTAKNTYPSGDATKVGHITVTQAVNLDTIESDTVTNNAKTGITAGQASDITANNAKISYTDAAAVTANTAKVTNATHTGDATGATALTIANNAVTNAKAAQMATKTYKGRTTAGTGNAEDVAVATLKTDLGLVKGDVGLGNVDNTTDAGKPVSTAQQTALNLKANNSRLINTTAPLSGGGDLSADRTLTTSMATNKLIGRSTAGTGVMEEITLGTNLSFTGTTLNATGGGGGGGDALVANPLSQFAATSSAQLAGVISNETGTGALVFGTSPALVTPTGIVKGDVGLGNVDNTADTAKPVSTAQATANTNDRARANHTGTQLASTISDLSKTSVGLSNVDNTSNATERAATATLANKTLTAPKIASGDFIYDENGNELVRFYGGASVVNNLIIQAGNTGTGVLVYPEGTDTNVNVELYAKGSGTVNVNNARVATVSETQTLTNKTLTTPTIADLTNMNHTHAGATTGGTIAHSALTGLTTGDPHTQYPLLAGRATGQTLIGGTASGDDLTLQSSSHGTKGDVLAALQAGERFLVGGTTMPTGNAHSTFGSIHNKTYSAAEVVVGNDMRSIPTFDTTGGGTYTGADLTSLPVATAAMATIVGVSFQAAQTGAGLVTNTVGVNAFATSLGAGGVTTATSARLGMGSFVGTVATQYGINFTNQGFLGSVTNGIGLNIPNAGIPASALKVGVDIEALTSATTNIGIRLAKSDTYTLQLSGTDGTAASGITFGTDTTLYRSAADTLSTGIISLPLVASPVVADTDRINLFGRKVGGRMLPSFMSPSGLSSVLQPLLARNKIGYWNPPGNATTVPGVFGFSAPSVVGTATTRNVATTNGATRMRRLGYRSVTTAGGIAEARVTVAQFSGGSGLDDGSGFFYLTRFVPSNAADVSGERFFIGVRNLTGAGTNLEPNTFTNSIGLAQLSTDDTQFYIVYGGSAAQTEIACGTALGAPNTRSTAAYELAIFSPNSLVRTYYVQATNIFTGETFTTMLSGTTVQVPSETTLMSHRAFKTNNATALEVAFDICSIYVETDT